ncbi:hemin-binding protein [Arcobacter sp. F155]|uniref:ShlB/FhaC/HecB family hemolysin secretion/activation protein n=1 Tax=Arcobacter sp. F155 TaxID=2044512 RepID=UPI00100B7D28|nr:ShlB/FhaC/HecB family hemolysin secretion/activation protein [Arcobacter sp. F155]RXJ78462.1 hemin-binding protein [Arcobacter sp. F155]
MKKTSILLVAATLSLNAAPIPNIGNLLNEAKPPKIQKKKEILPPLVQESEEYKRTLEDGKKVKVKKFLITGAIQLSNKELKKIVRPYEQKMLSFKDMKDITELITKAYKDKGYFIARAYIPVQNLQKQNKLLKIAVIEGEYGDFELQNNSLVKDSVLQAKLEGIKKNKIISTESLQRGLLLINETPGVKVINSKIKPGKDVGTSSFVIGLDRTKPYNGYIIVDNYGSPYTGEYRAMAGLDINSPFRIGDKLSISALSSDDIGLLNGRVAYELPLNGSGLKGSISYAKTTYELGERYKTLDALGDSDSFSANISYPYLLSPQEILNTYLQTSYNKMSDEMRAVDSELKKSTLVAKLGIDYMKRSLIFGKYSESKIDTSISYGRLKFKEEQDRLSDQDSANTNGDFSKLNIDLENTLILSEKFTWKNKLQLQYALGDKNLDGSEDMSLGGINGVKLYPSGEESAENGYIYTTELTYNLPSSSGINSKIGLFYDNARVYMSKNITNEKSRTLQDIGLSYYGRYEDFFINSHLAYKVGAADISSENDYNSRFMFQLGYIF